MKIIEQNVRAAITAGCNGHTPEEATFLALTTLFKSVLATTGETHYQELNRLLAVVTDEWADSICQRIEIQVNKTASKYQ